MLHKNLVKVTTYSQPLSQKSLNQSSFYKLLKDMENSTLPPLSSSENEQQESHRPQEQMGGSSNSSENARTEDGTHGQARSNFAAVVADTLEMEQEVGVIFANLFFHELIFQVSM